MVDVAWQALMAAAPFCGLLGTLRDAAALLEPGKELPTLRAFAELAMEFQPVPADAPNGALTVSDRWPGICQEWC